MIKNIIILFLLFIVSTCYSQTQLLEFRKSKTNNTNYNIFISKYPDEIVVNVEYDNYLGAEVSIFDTTGNVLASTNSTNEKFYFKKSILLGNKTIFVLMRSKNYIIREKIEL